MLVDREAKLAARQAWQAVRGALRMVAHVARGIREVM